MLICGAVGLGDNYLHPLSNNVGEIIEKPHVVANASFENSQLGEIWILGRGVGFI